MSGRPRHATSDRWSRGGGIHLGQLANLQQGSRPSGSRGGGHVVAGGSVAGGRRCGGLLRAMLLQWLMLCLLAAAVSAPSHAPALLASRCSGLRHGLHHGLQPRLLPDPRIVYFRHASGPGNGELPFFLQVSLQSKTSKRYEKMLQELFHFIMHNAILE